MWLSLTGLDSSLIALNRFCFLGAKGVSCLYLKTHSGVKEGNSVMCASCWELPGFAAKDAWKRQTQDCRRCRSCAIWSGFLRENTRLSPSSHHCIERTCPKKLLTSRDAFFPLPLRVCLCARLSAFAEKAKTVFHYLHLNFHKGNVCMCIYMVFVYMYIYYVYIFLCISI